MNIFIDRSMRHGTNYMIDAHNHLHFDLFDSDRDDVIQTAIDVGVECMLVADYDSAQRAQLLALAKRSGVFVTLGIHPWAAVGEKVGDELAKLDDDVRTHRDEIVGIGELGLDRLKPNLEQQSEVFRSQLQIARALDLPIVLHSVKANQQVIEILRSDGIPAAGGMVHGFGGSVEEAKSFRDLGIDISIGTTVTKSNARKILDVVRAVGLSHLMVETDAPSRPPKQVDRARCEPSDLIYVIDAVAETLGISADEVARATTARVRERFNLSSEVLR